MRPLELPRRTLRALGDAATLGRQLLHRRQLPLQESAIHRMFPCLLRVHPMRLPLFFRSLRKKVPLRSMGRLKW